MIRNRHPRSFPRIAPFAGSAEIYDLVYAAKNYAQEATIYAENLEPAKSLGSRLIDWGSGTGNFLPYWAQFGWQAIGIEPSATMRAVAARKNLATREGQLGHPVDVKCEAATACFAVMCHACPTFDALVHNLSQIRATMPVGGRFVFDVVNRQAAKSKLIRRRLQTVHSDGSVVARRILKRFHEITGILTVTMNFSICDSSGRTRGWREVHQLRTFSPHEIRAALKSAKFTAVAVLGFDDPSNPSDDENAWSLLVVAEASP